MSDKNKKLNFGSTNKLTNKKIVRRAGALAHADKIAQAQELLQEIDELALLLHEVKKQSERIQAAADAIGDSLVEVLSPRTDSRATGGNRKSRVVLVARTGGRSQPVGPTSISAPPSGERTGT